MKNTFDDFLKFVDSQKEVCLAIANDEAELAELAGKLKEYTFQHIPNVFELLQHVSHPSKSFFIVQECLSKDVYDFVVQYPTGQVEVYDNMNHTSQTALPRYTGVAVVLLLTRATLTRTQAAGFMLLERVGITYQN